MRFCFFDFLRFLSRLFSVIPYVISDLKVSLIMIMPLSWVWSQVTANEEAEKEVPALPGLELTHELSSQLHLPATCVPWLMSTLFSFPATWSFCADRDKTRE